MSVSQADFVAFKGETADRLKKVEDAVLKTIEEMQKAAPWSVSIEIAEAAYEAKAEAAHTQGLALFEGAKLEVGNLRQRATDHEKKGKFTEVFEMGNV